MNLTARLASRELTDDDLIYELRKQLAQQTRQSLENITTEQIVEAALLEDSSVNECVVLVRETETSKKELVAYVVSSGQFDAQRLQSHLQSVLPAAWVPIAYIPVSSLPLTSTGQVDKETLARLEAIAPDLVQRWEERLQSLPEVEQVAVVVQEYTENIPPLHLSDLLPDWKAQRAIALKESVATSDKSATVQSESEPKALALTQGESLQEEPDAPATLPEALQRAAQKTQGQAIVYLQANGSESAQSYAALLQEAQQILAGLRKLGLKPQDKVMFQLELTQDIIAAFWGCVLGGFIPVIMAVPPTYGESNAVLDKLCHVWKLLDKPLIITSEALGKSVQSLSQWLPVEELKLTSIEELRTNEPDTCHHPSQPNDVAFFTLTSGSTGVPKCIMLTHRNVLARARGTLQLCQRSPEDVILNWLPFDHIGSISDWHISSVDRACQSVYVPKEYVIGRPLNWLDLIDKYRITHTWGPNFAYSLINEALKQASGQSWDLSCMKSLLNAGESVSPKAVEEFLANLAPYGLKKTAIQPAFGMAEFGSGITYFLPTEETPLLFHTVDRASLGGSIVEVSPEHPNSITFTSLGPVIPSVSMRIVDQSNTVLPEDTVGRLQVNGEVVFSGYYKAPEVNKEVFSEDGWFDTGDLGFISKDQLVITGRAKETIIINGANYYNGEIEAVVEEVEGVEVSYTAACAVRDFGSDAEKLAIFFSSPLSADDQVVELIKKIQERVVRKVGVKPTYFIPVEKEVIPKTAIGKIQRSQLSRRFEAGEFDAILKRLDILMGNANTLPNWLYRKSWRPKEAVAPNEKSITGQSLVFLDRLGLGEVLCEKLDNINAPCIHVEIGSDFHKLSANRYRVNPKNPEDYQQLLKSLREDEIQIDRILHMWTYDEYAGEIESPEALEQSQALGTYSLLFLIQALAKQNTEYPVQLYAIASHTQPTSTSDEIACEKAPILGLLKTAPQEMPWLNCHHIDLPVELVDVNAARILQEIRLVKGEQEVAYRNGQRLVSFLEKVDLHQSEKRSLPFKEGGMYLLSGGLGGIAVEIAEYLLKTYKAKLLLVGRTPLPERSTWETHLEQADVVSQRIKAYLALEQLEGEIRYEAVDICDLTQLQQVVERTKSNWQCDLDGVLHLAGVFQEHLLVEETRDSWTATLRPKVLGTWVLSQLLKNQPNSVFISFSSVSSFLAGATMGAYAAANSFIDCFSHYQRYQRSLQSYCFAWTAWDEVGMSRGYQMKEMFRARGYYTITQEQGLQSLLAGLHHGQAQLMVGLDGTKLPIRRYKLPEAYRLQKLCAYYTAPSDSVPMAKLQELEVRDRFQTLSTCDFVQLQEMPLTATGEIDRDQLAARRTDGATAERVAPRTELERQLVNIWQEVLGMPQVGIRDNFFELGGSSILAVRLFTEIEKTFGKNLPLPTLFTAPTIEQLANLLPSQEISESIESLVPLQPNGNKPPLFCIYGILLYHDLARNLGSDQPVYGVYLADEVDLITGRTEEKQQTVSFSVQERASLYLKEIRKLQPVGPYFLAGESFGGLIAFEMAQQLHKEGEKVELLALLDTLDPSFVKGLRWSKWVSLHGQQLLREGPTYAFRKLGAGISSSKDKLLGIISKISRKLDVSSDQSLPSTLSTHQPKDIRKEVYAQAMRNYTPQPYPGKVTFFRAMNQNEFEAYYTDRQFWGKVAEGGLEVHNIPGDHLGILQEPNVQILAAKLRACLEAV